MKAELAALRARTDLVGAPLRSALTQVADHWLAGLLGAAADVALVAVGGYGRGDPGLASDLDLVLVHRPGCRDVGALADRVWYPVWDAGIGLDHSVRTVDEAVSVARDDLKAALGLLDARYVAGDRALCDELVAAARAQWRAGASRQLPELHATVRARAEAHGEVAFLLEPDLKEARGGLRDLHALRQVALTQLADPPPTAVRAAGELLLDVRSELHRRVARPGRAGVDRLLLQEQDGVAAALGVADADVLMGAVAAAGRLIGYTGDVTWRRVEAALASSRRRWGARRPAVVRRPLADGVVEQDGEVVLARDADPGADPVLVLRVAAAAAEADLPIGFHALQRLAGGAQMPAPWPTPARAALVALLGAGPGLVAVWEDLDQAGLIARLLPEWERVRSKPQRNAVHRFTVDRHLVEAAAAAARLTRDVARPDLLLIGALLHDIGKGWPGDHTETGMAAVAEIGPRLGLPAADVATLVTMVAHHLLLPDTATRRDLDDPATTRLVADAVGDRDTLDLLHALTVADAAATGPAAWSEWKAGLVEELVRRTAATLAGAALSAPDALTDDQRSLVDGGALAVRVDAGTVTVVAPDRPGLLSLSAGVLALHRLDVHSALARSIGASAVTVFEVAPRFGAGPEPARLAEDVRRAVDGRLAVHDLLIERERAYPPAHGVAIARRSAPPRVLFLDDVAESATVVEVRAHDAAGLLHRVTGALERCGLDVRKALVSTLGAEVVDAFYVVDAGGGRVSDLARRAEVERAVLGALAG